VVVPLVLVVCLRVLVAEVAVAEVEVVAVVEVEAAVEAEVVAAGEVVVAVVGNSVTLPVLECLYAPTYWILEISCLFLCISILILGVSRQITVTLKRNRTILCIGFIPRTNEKLS
jgi:hypothetical protein